MAAPGEMVGETSRGNREALPWLSWWGGNGDGREAKAVLARPTLSAPPCQGQSGTDGSHNATAGWKPVSAVLAQLSLLLWVELSLESQSWAYQGAPPRKVYLTLTDGFYTLSLSWKAISLARAFFPELGLTAHSYPLPAQWG